MGASAVASQLPGIAREPARRGGCRRCRSPAPPGEDIEPARPDRSHAIVIHSRRAVLNMLPETNNEPGAENDAAKEEDDAKERPKEHHGCHRRRQCTQLPPGGRSHPANPGSQRAPHTRSSASHLSILSSVIRVGRARQASTGVWGMAAGGAGSTACLAAGCAGHEDGQDRHLIEQPMLGRCGSGTGWPARVSSMAARSSSPVTGLPLPGVDWSNAPR